MRYKGKEIVVLMHTKQTDPVRAAYDLNDQVGSLQQAVIALSEELSAAYRLAPDLVDLLAPSVLAVTHEMFQTEKEKA